MKRVYPEPNTGCWLWAGRLNHDGYGALHGEDNEFGVFTAHRYSYLFFKGQLSGLNVLHKCDVRCCVNPDHLFLGTQTENIKDMDNKKRRVNVNGEKSGMVKLTSIQALEIKKLYSTGKYYQKQIAEKFNVDRSAVASIVAGRTWRHVSGIDEIKRHTKRRGGDYKRRFTELEAEVMRSCIESGLSGNSVAKYFKTNSPTIFKIRRNIYY